MDIRSKFLEFFKSKGHQVYTSMPLVPDDASLLFTNAGMVQFKDIFTGKIPIPSTPRATSSQLCIRAGGKHNDLENVGFTRRHHPMLLFSRAKTLEEAIEVERDLFNRLNERAVLHIDTTKMGLQQLRTLLYSRLSFKVKPEFTISFMSFGFKHGLPIDADIVCDVRFLPNPYYIDELKEKTGDNQEVYDYVMKFDETKEFCRRLHDYIDYVLTQYEKQKRSHLTIAVGCTGGHHRSVTIANWLHDLYKDRYQCFLSHRDIKV